MGLAIPDARLYGINTEGYEGFPSGELCAIVVALFVYQSPCPNKVTAIKVIKRITGCELEEARRFVDAVYEYNRVILLKEMGYHD